MDERFEEDGLALIQLVEEEFNQEFLSANLCQRALELLSLQKTGKISVREKCLEKNISDGVQASFKISAHLTGKRTNVYRPGEKPRV